MSKPVDTDSWETPDDLFEHLDNNFHFDYDACASKKNTKCVNYWTKYEDIYGYMLDPAFNVWMNPPYSRGNIDRCMEWAFNQSLVGSIVVCLVRDDPSTKWYNKWVDGKASKVLRLRKRVTFKGGDGCYNFPVCVVIYNCKFDNVTHYKQWSIGEEI